MDEIVLESGVPVEVDPAGSTYTIYNSMNADDALMCSSHGDITKKWLRVEGGDYLKFANPIFLLQNRPGQLVLPIYETI